MMMTLMLMMIMVIIVITIIIIVKRFPAHDELGMCRTSLVSPGLGLHV